MWKSTLPCYYRHSAVLFRPVAGPGSWLLLDGLYRLGLEQVVGGLLPQPGLP